MANLRSQIIIGPTKQLLAEKLDQRKRELGFAFIDAHEHQDGDEWYAVVIYRHSN